MASAFDFKKEYKDLYLPPAKPVLITVPPMRFIAVDGMGNPNTEPSYAQAMEILYGLSYTIKMSKMTGNTPQGYFDYVVPPLEGLWRLSDTSIQPEEMMYHKDALIWTSLLRQPDFVTEEVFEGARETLAKKKPGLDLSRARLMDFEEGLCVQILHIGPYDAEPASVRKMEAFAVSQGYRIDLSDTRPHHEIYLNDPRKTAQEKLKTVIRHPVA